MYCAIAKNLSSSKCKKPLEHKACFQHDMIYWDFKDLPRRVASDKVLHDKAFKIDSDSKYDGY